ncbi:MAG: hypothetical protein ACI4RJ_04465 [Alphaproteobacteria bacterium]
MDEMQLDNFMGQIQKDVDVLRKLQNTDVVLTDSQKEELKKLPKNQQEEKEKAFIKANEEEKLKRRMLLVSELEDKIRAAGLPAEATDRLLAVIQQTKDNNWKFSPDAINKLENAKQDELAKEQKKQEENTHGGDIFVPVAAGIAATTAASAFMAQGAKQEEEEKTAESKLTKRIANAQHLHQVVNNVAQKAMAKVATETGKKPEEINLDDINRSSTLNEMQKKVARKKHLEDHPEIKKDMQIEEKLAQDKAIAKSERRYARKQAKKNGQKTPQQINHRPNYTPQEWALVKKVNKIKQKAGTLLSVEQINKQLSAEDAKAYTAFMRKHNPTLFTNRKEAERLQIKRKLEEKRDAHRRQQQAQAKTDSMQTRTAKQESGVIRPQEMRLKTRRTEERTTSKAARKQHERRSRTDQRSVTQTRQKTGIHSLLKDIRLKNIQNQRDNENQGVLAGAVNRRRKGYQ